MTPAEINFEELFDAAPNPYLVLDADLVIRYANRAYLQATGRTREELAGQYILEAFPVTPAAAPRRVTSAPHSSACWTPASPMWWLHSDSTFPLPTAQVNSRSGGGAGCPAPSSGRTAP